MQEQKIISGKDRTIAVTIFESEASAIVVVLASATGVKKKYYQKFAEYLQSKAISVITFDYFGIGHSLDRPIRKVNTSAQNWGNLDLNAVLDYAKIKFSEKKIVLFGHSIGGQLIGMTPNAVFAKKIITVGSQSGFYKLWKGKERRKMWFNWFVFIPNLAKILGYLPSKKIMKMENLPKGMAIQWGNWCKHENYFYSSVPKTEFYYEKLTENTVIISIEDDHFAPKEAVDWLGNQFRNSTRIHWKPKDFGMEKIGHFGVFKSLGEENLWPILLKEITSL